MSNEEINILIQILENAREMEPGSNPRAAFLVELFFMVSDKMRPSVAADPPASSSAPKPKRVWSPERREAAAERMRAMLAKRHGATAGAKQE